MGLDPFPVIRKFFWQFAFTHLDSLGLAWTGLDANVGACPEKMDICVRTFFGNLAASCGAAGRSEPFVRVRRRATTCCAGANKTSDFSDRTRLFPSGPHVQDETLDRS